jgi:hypothetical protein
VVLIVFPVLFVTPVLAPLALVALVGAAVVVELLVGLGLMLLGRDAGCGGCSDRSFLPRLVRLRLRI